MGEKCSRLDCSAVEDCTSTLQKKDYVFWYDCAGQPLRGAGPGSLAHHGGEAQEQVVIPLELEVPLTSDNFAVARTGFEAHARWKRRYVLGRELGAGQTAVVWEAFTTPQEDDMLLTNGRSGSPRSAGAEASASKIGALGRRVALKKLNSTGTTTFRQEVRAHMTVGIHPHILRMLECFYEGGDDVLVLEYCEGGDVYELYAQNNGCGMSEHFVVQLMRQVLLALDHLTRHGVEHRDVKPENLLLYGSSQNGVAPHIKLADFGWSTIMGPTSKPAPVPPEGVGSLWYAPPELNPPVKGVTLDNSDLPMGQSDMWSVGIITYLLLVGHSPFNSALRTTDPVKREEEVLRLAALGQLNASTRSFTRLSQEARDFICALIVPKASSRLTPVDAWNHRFMSRFHPRFQQDSNQLDAPVPSVAERPEATMAWKRLDGFQRLAWLSIARAVSEPELLDGQVFQTLISQQKMGMTSPYLTQLAMELAATAIPEWLEPNTAWSDVLRLAFRYLDVDIDGLIGAADMAKHVAGSDGATVASTWLMRWGRSNNAVMEPGSGWPPSQGEGNALTFTDFRMALWSSFPRRAGVLADPQDQRSGPKQSDWPEAIEETALFYRMKAIDEVCEQFVEAEATMISADDHTTWW